MKTTVDLPEDLLRRAKSSAALQGRKLRELVQEGLERVLNESAPPTGLVPVPSAFDLMQDGCGIISTGIGDLSSNPKHLESFGHE
jgi:predicted component of type VI protein secretion system